MNTAGVKDTANASARLAVSASTGNDRSSRAVAASNRWNRNSTAAPPRAVRTQTIPNMPSRSRRRSIMRDTTNDPAEKPSRKPATINEKAWEVDSPKVDRIRAHSIS